MPDDQKKKWMRQALELAEQATGQVAPNPPVGALLVADGVVIGQGYHQKFGGPHAEINALTDCKARGHDPAGACLYVTLEPCCHTGKTGPCTEAIADAGIREVIIGCRDENPQVAGQGIAWLRQRGISVEVGCCEDQAKRLAAGFFKWQRTKQPRVILKWAQSLNGKLAWPVGSQRRWISNEKSREHVQTLRQRCGAILVGIETVLADDPKLSVRLDDATFQSARIVLDSRLRLPLESHLAQTAQQQPVWIFTLASSLEQNLEKVEQFKRMGCEIMAVSQCKDRLDLMDVLEYIGDRGITDLLVEGGARVIESFLNQRLADEVNVYIAPMTIDADQALPKIGIAGWDSRQAITGQLNHPRIRHFDQDVLIQGQVR